MAGFSATTVTRLLTLWQEEHNAWRKRSLADEASVYLWTPLVSRRSTIVGNISFHGELG